MKATALYILLLLCLIFCGCENKQMTDKARAELCLQTLRAKDKDKQPLADCDSLISQAVAYYNQANSPVKEAEVWFYKARICAEKEKTGEAVKNYQKALSLLERTKDYQLLSKIYTNLGRIYLMNDLYRPALNSYKEGFNCDSLLNHKIDMCFDLRGIAIAYQFINKEDSAFLYFNKAHEICQSAQDSSLFMPLILSDFVEYYIDHKDYKKAFMYLSKLENLPIDKKSSDIYYHKGCLFNKTHKYDSAYYYLNMNINTCDIYDKVPYYKQLRIAAKGMGDYQKATEYAELYEAGADSIIKLSKALDIQKVESENLYERIKKNHINVETIYTILLFCILLSTILVYKQHRTKTTTHRELTPLKKKRKQSSFSELPVQSLELMPIYKRIADLPKEKKEVSSSDQKPFTPEEFDELMRTVKTIFPEFIRQLHTACSLLTEEDLLFCCLVKANLSQLTISYCFMSFDTNPCKQRKKRIKQKLTVQTDNRELFESLFPDKKSD